MRLVWAACLLAAATLLVVHGVRIAAVVGLRWWMPVAVLGAGWIADLVSGVVHWAADTWGRDTMPVVGQRFLRPFRVHHVNPDDFLRRDFLDCNGDVAMLTLPVLLGAFALPLDTAGGAVGAVLLVSFAAWSLPTNQVHQWAHMPHPPTAVRWLQRRRLILSPEAHRQHHQSPYAVNYCIATGWSNRWLTNVDAFRRIERAITTAIGVRPRVDDQVYAGIDDR